MTPLTQETSIVMTEGRAAVFHPPYANNYTWVLVNRSLWLSRYKKRIMKLFFSLNMADINLSNYCRSVLDQYQHADPWKRFEIARKIQDWQQKYESKKNLLAWSDSKFVVGALCQIAPKDRPFLAILRKERPEIIGAFLSLPNRISETHRINVAIPHSTTEDFLKDFLEGIAEKRFSGALIEKIEIAKNMGVVSDITNYPTFIVYLKSRFTKPSKVDSVHEMLKFISGLLDRYPASCLLSDEHVYRWRNNASVSHGFRLYKRYLDMLGILPEVYEETNCYALLKEKDTVFPLALEGLRRVQ